MKNLILSAMFGLGFSMVSGCAMEQATEADIAETEQAIITKKCMVQSATNNLQTGYCYLGGNARYNPMACPVGGTFGASTDSGGTWNGQPAYVNGRPCN